MSQLKVKSLGDEVLCQGCGTIIQTELYDENKEAVQIESDQEVCIIFTCRFCRRKNKVIFTSPSGIMDEEDILF
jgi:hypothetical protein